MPQQSDQPNISESDTLVGILARLSAGGFPGQLVAQSGARIKCHECKEFSPSDRFRAEGYRRVEGASDPADLNLLAWGACPDCATGGTLILGYGPNASPADVELVEQLDLTDLPTPGATPPGATPGGS